MYILQQIKTQFIQNILAFEIGGGPDDGFRGGEEVDTPQTSLQEGEVYEAAARLEEQLDGVKNEKTFHSQYCTKIGNFLEGVKNGKYPDLDPNDKEFAEMLSKYDKRIEYLEALAKEGHQIESELDFYLAQLSEKIDDKIVSSSDSGLSEAMRKQDEQTEVDLEKEEDLERLRTERDSLKSRLRMLVGNIDKESDEFKAHTEDYQKIISLAESISDEKFVYHNFDEEGNIIGSDYETIVREIEHLEDTYRRVNIIIHNEQKEGETTLGEAKDAKIQEKFLDLKENGTEVQKEIIGEKGFLDLTAADFQRLQLDGEVDLSEWFLRPGDDSDVTEGKLYTLHFGGNNAVKDIVSNIIPIHIDSVVIDGKSATRQNGTQFSFDRGGHFSVMDGSEIIIKDVNREVQDDPEKFQERVTQFREQMASNVNRANFESQVSSFMEYHEMEGNENEDGWFMTMFKKVMNFMATAMGEDPIFEEALEKEKPLYEGYSNDDIARIERQGMRRFVPNGNELLRDNEFMTELSSMCDRLGVQRDDMLIVMQAESKLNPAEVNDRSDATGLIQFMPKTAIGLGTSVAELETMSAVEQLVYVEKYFKNYAGRMNSVADIYRVVFYPASIGKPSDWVLGSQNGTARKVANQNGPGITQHSRRSDGLIDNATFDRYVDAKISQFSELVAPSESLGTEVPRFIQDEGIGEITRGIQSENMEVDKNPDGSIRMTYCSKTARLNLDKLGVSNPEQGDSARASYEEYGASKISSFPPADTDAKVADLYLDASDKNRKYGHRAACFKQNGEWYVLDPYYGDDILGVSSRNNPIPAMEYISFMKNEKGRNIWGAAYFK